MSHPFFWPGQYFFYPIGNTPPVCLTRDLPREERADILLLGCGDPRHVLYTICSEPESLTRRLDFTCVDFEPGVLARNILLFTFIADDIPVTTIWNIFYHMYLDVDSHAILVAQCRKLVESSKSIDVWRRSPYAAYLRASTEYTLTEVRFHWSSYAMFSDLPPRRQEIVREAFSQVFKQWQGTDRRTIPIASARSAGPLFSRAIGAVMTQPVALHYWDTGTTFAQPQDVSSAKLINPTFAYSLAGEGCAVHYGTDPLTMFHFAALFGNAKSSSVSASEMVRSAKAQFSEWHAAFRRAISGSAATCPQIRFFLAEAMNACHALRSFGSTGTLSAMIPVMQLRTQLIALDQDEYTGRRRAPAMFNVIDTSNLIDHIGLLNILVTAIPLLSSSPSTVLYTESLLFRGEDATKEFGDLLYADIGTMGLLLDLCPIDYLSGFSTRSNTHEILMRKVFTNMKNSATTTTASMSQFHQVTTWKSPASCDSITNLHGGRPRLPPAFDTRQLGTLLFDVYHGLFEQEDAETFWKQNQHNLPRAVAASNLVHDTREGFVLLLKLVKERLRITPEQWLEVMDRFLDLEKASTTMPMNAVSRNDLYAHLLHQSVHTPVNYYKSDKLPRTGRFSGWNIIPPVVRIIFSIPRERIAAFENILVQIGVGTPPMECNIHGSRSHSVFCAVHAAFGRVISTGTNSNPRVLFEEDPQGQKGSFPLVASFVIPAPLLINIDPPHDLSVRLCVRKTAGTVRLYAKLGLDLEIFSARLMDEEHVHVLPEQSAPSVNFDGPSESVIPPNSTLHVRIGKQNTVSVELDEQCELVSSLTARVNIEDSDVIREFGAGATPGIKQVSPCLMRLTVAGHVQDVVFPFPVIGSQNKLRLARKSRYIEVVVPVAGPFLKPDGMKLNPFPVTLGHGKALSPWNVHHLTLDRLPVLDLAGAQQPDQWLNPHVGSMFSARESKMRKKNRPDVLMFVKDTIHSICVRSAGIQGGAARRIFSLIDMITKKCDTVFFISDLRFDLHSHTVVCDGYVLPLTDDLTPKIASFFNPLVESGGTVGVRVFEGEMDAWKQILPAFVERCRTWEHADTCEYLARQEVPLSQEAFDDPLCSCGTGKDVEGLLKVKEWRRYAPYVTRVAISPLFAVSYLEAIGRDPAAHKCSVCREKGKPKLMECKGCHKVRYCSVDCQKKDWPRHKPKCKP